MQWEKRTIKAFPGTYMLQLIFNMLFYLLHLLNFDYAVIVQEGDSIDEEQRLGANLIELYTEMENILLNIKITPIKFKH